MTKQQAEFEWMRENPLLVMYWCHVRKGTKYAMDRTPDHCAYVARLGNPRAVEVMARYKAMIVTARLRS